MNLPLLSSLMFTLTVCPILAFSAPQDIGVVKHVDIHYAPPHYPGNWIWSWQHNGSRFLQLHFENIYDGGNSQYEIVIRDYKFNIVTTFHKSSFAQSPHLWTGPIGGDSVVIEVKSLQGEPIIDLQFDISDIAYQQDGGKILSISGENQLRPIYEFRNNPAVFNNSRSVARLTFAKSDRMMACTGFLIDENHLMTNNHCIPDQNTCESTTIWFGYEDERPGSFNPNWEESHCRQVERTSVSLDYSVLRLTTNASKWGRLKITPLSIDNTTSTPLYIIQHPGGESKQVSLLDCAILTPYAKGISPQDTDFGHTCDTMSGSSGAPVFDQSHNLIGLHHLGMCNSGRWAKENRAVLGTWILNDLKSPSTAPEATLQECTELQPTQ